MGEYLVVDRIEGDYAVCECSDGTMVDIKMTQIHDKIKDGDVIYLTSGFYRIDKDETEKRKQDIERITREMWE